jgi:hypothetical protein
MIDLILGLLALAGVLLLAGFFGAALYQAHSPTSRLRMSDEGHKNDRGDLPS